MLLYVKRMKLHAFDSRASSSTCLSCAVSHCHFPILLATIKLLMPQCIHSRFRDGCAGY